MQQRHSVSKARSSIAGGTASGGSMAGTSLLLGGSSRATAFHVPQQQQAPTGKKSLRIGLSKRLNSGTQSFKESEQYAQFKKMCYKVVEHKYFQLIMFLLTLFALVGDDIRVAGTSKAADPVFDGIVIFCLFMFSTEIILASIGKDDYFLGFFFTLDCVATLSLILDIQHIAYALASGGEEGGDEGDIARAGRASRAGTRAGRVVRVIRLIRLVRIVKLYKTWLDRKNAKDSENQETEGQDEVAIGDQSRVGKKLSQQTTQRVIILVLVMLFCIPQLNLDAQFENSLSARQYGIDVVYKSWQQMQCYSGNWTSKEASICSSANYDSLSAEERKVAVNVVRKNFERELLMYIYYHNPHQESCADFCEETYTCMCANTHMSRLFWIGHVERDSEDGSKDAFIQELVSQSDKWDNWFNEKQFSYITGSIPSHYKGRISTRMSSPQRCPAEYYLKVNLIGVSVVREIDCPMELRYTERTGFTAGQSVSTDVRGPRSPGFIFFFDERIRTSREALFNVAQTVFICIVLGFGAMFFSNDVNTMVLGPIERMIQKVQKIRQDPLYAMKLGDEQFKEQYEAEQEQELEKMTSRTQTGRSNPGRGHAAGLGHDDRSKLISTHESENEDEDTWWKGVKKKWNEKRKELAEKKKAREKKQVPLETRILENSIIKLGSLLALGFGEAGSDIIGKNLDEDAAGVQAMLPGIRVDAIYGFCDIRNFTDATEVLQHKVMVFVNQIADIVHSITDEFMGAPNKNVGDAFLLVWNVSKIDEKDKVKRAKYADMSVMAFVKIVAAINRSPFLSEYREHPALLARMPNYRVRMGFGLHFGYSIEGAIGSEFKIDASYLSPNVNMASRLEAATKQYGVTILISESVVTMCSGEMCEKCRAIDHVMVRGSNKPIRIYTMDIQETNLRIDYTPQPKDKNRYKIRQQREAKKKKYLEQGFSIRALFDADKDVKAMRMNFMLNFFQQFEKGYLNYEAGEWDVAEEVFERTKKMVPGVGEDGPSVALLAVMKQNNFQAPSEWQGYRSLTEK